MIEIISALTGNRWFGAILGAALLGLIVWFFGPLLGYGAFHPLDGVLARVVAIAVVVVLSLLAGALLERRETGKDEALAAEVARDPSADAAAEEIALLSERLRDALASLRKIKLGGKGRRGLARLPWYLFIGPPGAGKTTALVNSGLNFPLADSHGPQALKGVGGTRHCDWWFTDQAVLIDTAGRYTTQDSDEKADAGAWLGFLRLLRKHRRRQPLNGVLVAIGLAQLAALGEAERSSHARAVRRRLRELHDELGLRIPVYVLFTKADLVAGFVEFFDALTREEREEVWGTTFAFDDGQSEGGAVAGFPDAFASLLGRIGDRLPERLQQETDLRRRRLIYGFPQQLAALREVASEFLAETFRPSRLEPRTLLRGVYVTSGTQDGTPIDRLLGAMAGQFGLSRQAIVAHSGTGRSYFLTRLMRDVVFGEAGLVRRDPKLVRADRRLQIGGIAAAGIVLLVLVGAWTASWSANMARIRAVRNSVALYDRQFDALRRQDPGAIDLAAVVPPLQTLRTLPGGYDDGAHSTPVAFAFGLSQARKLHVAEIDAYRQAADRLLLPRLLHQLEAQIQSHLGDPDVLYEALKVYLILGRQGPMDRGLVEQWIGADLAANLPGDDRAADRSALAGDLGAMLGAPLPAVPLDGPLIAQARSVLTREPFADYVYNRLMRSALVQSLPTWTVADHAGPAGAKVFALRDGRSLETGVPGIYTTQGYHDVFLRLLPGVTRQAAEADWVLGRSGSGGEASEAGEAGEAEGVGRLRRDVLSLYLDDYTRRWDAMLADIALKPFTTVSAGQDELFLLSAPDSPLRDLLLAIDEETQLGRPKAESGASARAEKRADKFGEAVTDFAAEATKRGMTFEQNEAASVIASAFGSDAAGKPVDPATRVDRHFAALNAFVVGSKDEPPKLDAVISQLQQIYQGLNRAGNAPNQGQALLTLASGGAQGSASQQLAAVAKDAPPPVSSMLQTVSESSASVTDTGAASELSDAWRSKVLPLCQQAFDRFPFVAGSASDVPIEDFTTLLGPGGLIDRFFDQYLKPFVNTDETPWRWNEGASAELGISDDALMQFERASEIRDALFPDGAKTPSSRFELRPIDLDPTLAQVSVEVGGTRLSYAHGPDEPVSMRWPAADGTTTVRVTLTPADGQPATIIEETGPWALLRLITAAHVTATGQPDKIDLTFSTPSGKASFEVDADSVRNPFTLTALRDFRCPPSL